MQKPEPIKMGELDALVVGNFEKPTKLVMLHGYGANQEDLLSLSGCADGFCWIFPNAPISLGELWGFESRTWFPLDMEGLEQATREATYREFFDHHRQVFETAQAQLCKAIESLKVPSEKLIIGGFSQGALMASHYFLNQGNRPKALLILSGMYPENAGWDKKISSGDKNPVFQSHGTEDPILSFRAAEELSKDLKSNHWPIHWLPFSGGHQIPLPVLNGLKNFLSQLS